MPRIYIPEIPDNIVNELDTLESTLTWIKALEVAEKRLEEELQQIKMVLKFVVRPKYNRLNAEEMRDANKETNCRKLATQLKEQE